MRVAGPFGQAIAESRRERLCSLVRDPSSELLRMFSPEVRRTNRSGNWYGEHLGKWLHAASLAAADEPALREPIAMAVDALHQGLEPCGYVGTCPPDSPARMENAREGTRTWDAWVLACLLQGLHRARPWADAAKLDDLQAGPAAHLARVLAGGKRASDLGNHQGLSALILVEPLAELAASGVPHAATACEHLIAEAEEALGLVTQPLAGVDPARLATGKAYQLCWFYTGLVAASSALRRPRLLDAAIAFADLVAADHLTLGGGPWGGLGDHPETFVPRGRFSPHGLVETCSTMAWIRLNIALGHETGEDRPYQRVEASALNDLLGAHLGGDAWNYFTMPNGPRDPAYDLACCRSSGALALEEVAASLVRREGEGWRLTQPWALDSPSVTAKFEEDCLHVVADGPCSIRVPSWAARIAPGWTTASHLALDHEPQLHSAAHRVEHHGREVIRLDYVAFTDGPWVLASAPPGGWDIHPTLRVPLRFGEEQVRRDGDRWWLQAPGHQPLELARFFEAGNRTARGWRSTWIAVAWQ